MNEQNRQFRTCAFFLGVALILFSGCKNANLKWLEKLLEDKENGTGGQPITNSTKTHELTVGRHVNIETIATDQKIDVWFSYGTSVIKTSTTAQDFPCNAQIKRKDKVGTFGDIFPALPDEVDSKEAYKAVIQAPFHVQIVSRIDWCGTPGVFQGCATRNDLGSIVITATANDDVLVHELGHALGHPGYSYPARHCDQIPAEHRFNIMLDEPCPGLVEVSQNDCNNYFRL